MNQELIFRTMFAGLFFLVIGIGQVFEINAARSADTDLIYDREGCSQIALDKISSALRLQAQQTAGD